MKKLTVKLGFVFLCLVLAGLYSGNLLQFVSWVSVIFISVLFHEVGHALTARVFGKTALIELSFLGGTTYFRQEGLKKWQLFLIALNGPVFGLGLFFLANVLLIILPKTSPFVYACQISSFINLFWTLFNLLPILPLDGGQLLRITLEGIFKNRGLFFAGVSSCVFATAFALWAFLMSQYFIGSILFLFAFQNFELVKQARYLTSTDREESFRKRLQEAVYLFETGQFELLEPILKNLIEETKQGMIFNQSSAMLSVIYRMKKDYKSVYELLKPLPKLYENELAAVMHEACFFLGDFKLAHQLSAEAFQKESLKQTAFHAALAAEHMKNDEATLGWLKTALELGLNVNEIKAHPVLKAFADRLNL
jgi:Zn-dependent protease